LSVGAKPVAQVTDVTGQVFGITMDGKTVTLKTKDHLEDKSEIMVGEGASVTLNDYYDATYHLISGSHLKFFDRSVQLKRGKAWIQSLKSRHPLALTTANGHVDFWKSEFIATFDHATSRSQILMVNGEAEVSNVLDKNMKYTVSAGTFTLVDPEVENGVPRTPTKVGLQSLNQSLSEFKKLPLKMIEETDPTTRTIASVTPTIEEKAPIKKGEIIFIASGEKMKERFPASAGAAYKYYSKKTIQKKAHPVSVTSVPIKFYGTSWSTPVKLVSHASHKPRIPASIPAPVKAVANHPHLVMPKFKVDPEFGESLKKQEAMQPAHSKELNSLIDDLQSY
jgi:hypothetical protein